VAAPVRNHAGHLGEGRKRDARRSSEGQGTLSLSDSLSPFPPSSLSGALSDSVSVSL